MTNIYDRALRLGAKTNSKEQWANFQALLANSQLKLDYLTLLFYGSTEELENLTKSITIAVEKENVISVKLVILVKNFHTKTVTSTKYKKNDYKTIRLAHYSVHTSIRGDDRRYGPACIRLSKDSFWWLGQQLGKTLNELVTEQKIRVSRLDLKVISTELKTVCNNIIKTSSNVNKMESKTGVTLYTGKRGSREKGFCRLYVWKGKTKNRKKAEKNTPLQYHWELESFFDKEEGFLALKGLLFCQWDLVVGFLKIRAHQQSTLGQLFLKQNVLKKGWGFWRLNWIKILKYMI